MFFSLVISQDFAFTCVDVSPAGTVTENVGFFFNVLPKPEVMQTKDRLQDLQKLTKDLKSSKKTVKNKKHGIKSSSTITHYPQKVAFIVTAPENEPNVHYITPIETYNYTALAPKLKVDYFQEGRYTLIVGERFQFIQEFEGFTYSLTCTNYRFTPTIPNFEEKGVANVWLRYETNKTSTIRNTRPYLRFEIYGSGRLDFRDDQIYNYAEIYQKESRTFLNVVLRNGYSCEFRGHFYKNIWFRDFEYEKDPLHNCIFQAWTI